MGSHAPFAVPLPRPSSAVGMQKMRTRIANTRAVTLLLGALPFAMLASILVEVIASSRDMEEEIAAMKTRK